VNFKRKFKRGDRVEYGGNPGMILDISWGVAEVHFDWPFDYPLLMSVKILRHSLSRCRQMLWSDIGWRSAET
jgi:hypothetical protein